MDEKVQILLSHTQTFYMKDEEVGLATGNSSKYELI